MPPNINHDNDELRIDVLSARSPATARQDATFQVTYQSGPAINRPPSD